MAMQAADDGSSPQTRRSRREGAAPRTVQSIAARPDAPTAAEKVEPGVDPQHAAESYTAGVDPKADPAENARRNTRRFLVPAGGLGVIMLGFFLIGLTQQLVVPIIGIVVTLALFGSMVLVSRRVDDDRRRVRLMGRLMLGMGLAMLVLIVAFGLVQSIGYVASVPPV